MSVVTPPTSAKARVVSPQELIDTAASNAAPSDQASGATNDFDPATFRPEAPVEPIQAATQPSAADVTLAANKLTTITPANTLQGGDTTDVAFIKGYIDQYLKYTSTVQIDLTISIKLFANILLFAVEHQSNATVLDVVLEFFIKHKNRILQPDTALQGVHHLNPNKRDKINVAYMLMYMASTGTSDPIDYEYAASVLQGSGYVTYIRSKLRAA